MTREIQMSRQEAIDILRCRKDGNAVDALEVLIRLAEAWDKVIEEIEEQFEGCDICEWFEDYDWDENNISEYRYAGSVDDILDIINKHLGER